MGDGASERLAFQSLRDRVAGHVRQSLALEAASPQWGAGLRTATAMMVPLAVAWALRRPDLASAGLGGWLAMLADPGGTYPVRARTMVAFTLAGAIATIAGTVAGQSPWTAVPALFACVLICSLVRVRGDSAAVSGVLTMIMFCIAEGSPGSVRQGLIRAELFAAGGLFAVLLAVAVWPFRPYRPVREAVAACWSALGDLSAAIARVAAVRDSPAWDALVPLRRRGREALEVARLALGIARAGRSGETRRGLQLLVLYEISELLLGDLAALLEALRSHAEHGQPIPEKVAEALLELARVQNAIASSIAESGPLPEGLRLPEVPAGEELGSLFARAAAETRYAIDSAHALEHGGEGPESPGARAPPDEWPSLRDALGPDSAELRHALRVAIVAMAGALLAAAFHLERSYWVTITVIIVLQPHAVATVRRALQRVGGTVIGGIVAAVIARTVRQPLVLAPLLFVFAFVGVALRRVNYAAFAALVTPVFVILGEVNAGGSHLTKVRILDTLLGGALALGGALILWPTRELGRMPALIAAVLRADRAYLHAVLHGEGNAAVVTARRQVGLATANAEAALQRLMGESAPADRIEPLMALVAYARRLSASITALGTSPVPPDQAARLEEALAGMAAAAQKPEPPPPLPPIEDSSLPEPAQRLARQLRVIHSALARLTSAG